MKAFKLAFVLAGLFSLPFAPKALAHPGNGTRVDFEVESGDTATAGNILFKFELIDNVKKVMVGDSDLNIDMEKKLHFIVYDESLQEFQHLHPVFANGQWSVDFTVLKNGNYWIWAQGQLAVDGTDFNASTRLNVTGGTVANALPPVLGDNRMGADGLSQVTISADPIMHGSVAMLMLDFSRTDGSIPNLSPYLGAGAHVTAVSSDGDSMVHVHPMATMNPNQMMLHMSIAEAGDYRVWIQFIDGGVLKLVPLSVTVQ